MFGTCAARHSSLVFSLDHQSGTRPFCSAFWRKSLRCAKASPRASRPLEASEYRPYRLERYKKQSSSLSLHASTKTWYAFCGDDTLLPYHRPAPGLGGPSIPPPGESFLLFGAPSKSMSCSAGARRVCLVAGVTSLDLFHCGLGRDIALNLFSLNPRPVLVTLFHAGLCLPDTGRTRSLGLPAEGKSSNGSCSCSLVPYSDCMVIGW